MSDAERIRQLSERLEALSRGIQRLEDVKAIRHLHHAYGYFIDKCLYDEAVDLFADDAELRFLNGVYVGKAGVRRLYCDWFRNYFTEGHNGPKHGFLLDHLQMQDIIDVAPDGRTALARFRALMAAGTHDTMTGVIEGFPRQCWEGGIYENQYVKDNGVWKIKLLNYNMLWQANYEEGWAHSGVHLMPFKETYPANPIGPDRIVPEIPAVWPRTRVLAFHYPHPVTGRPIAVPPDGDKPAG